MKTIFLLLTSLLLLNISAAFGADFVCSHFYNKLSELPHIQLTLNLDGFKSIWNGKQLQGCDVFYESHVSLVSGGKVYELFESFIQAPGWVINNNLVADGPGSSTVGIEKGTNRCLINWSQHAWIDEETKEHRQSSQIKMVVQCTLK
jgi:hypothetical protein